MGAGVTHHTIGIQQVEQILLGARRSGLDIGALLARAEISPQLLESPLSRVTQAQYARLIRVLARRMRDEFWGLTDHPLPLGSFATVCHHLIHCQTLGEALRSGGRYYRLLLQDFVPRLHVRDGIATFALHAPPPRDQRDFYAGRAFIFLAYGLACWLVARRIPLRHVNYMGGEIIARSDASRLFQAPLNYTQPSFGFAFDVSWLDLPVVQNAHSLKEFLAHAPGDLLVKYRDHSSVTERIRRILRRHLAEELPSLEEVSDLLAMTPQTLRRRLHQEGQGYQALKDALRRDAAIEYLARADLSLIDISALLGFSEPSTFHRAFKKWTGVAPGEYRHTRLRNAEAGADSPAPASAAN